MKRISKKILMTVISVVILAFILSLPITAKADEGTECEHVFNIRSLEEYPTCDRDGHYDRICGKCGYHEFDSVAPKLEGDHDWVLDDIWEASCKNEQKNFYRCSKCRDWKEEVVPGLGDHNFVEDPSRGYAPTCKYEGKRIYRCTVCQKTKSEPIEKLPHSFKAAHNEPTCSLEGRDFEYCEVCNERRNERVIPKKEHDFYTRETGASCKNIGQKLNVCRKCGYQEVVETYPKTDHSYYRVFVDPKCYKEGQEYYVCDWCGLKTEPKIIPKEEHRYKTVTKPATCSANGETYQECMVCGERTESKVLPKKPHNLYTVTEYATCTKEGKQYQLCSLCDYKSAAEKTLPKKSHNFANTTREIATCSKEGKQYRECLTCGAKDYLTIPKRTHIVNTYIEYPTCTQTGREYNECLWCGEIISEKVLPKKEHTLKTVTEPATCTKAGRQYMRCNLCDYKTVEKTLPKKDHDFSVLTKTVEPTATKEGYKEYKCSRCEATHKEQIPIKEEAVCKHKSKKYVKTREANCISKPLYDMVCEDCNEVVKTNVTKTGDTADKNNHEHMTSSVTKQPNYREAGVRSYTCSDCGYRSAESIPKLTCTHKQSTSTKYNSSDGKFYIICDTCGENLGLNGVQNPTVKECKHSHGYTEKVVKKATATQWGKVQKICKDCNKVVSEHDVHPYSTYTVQYTDGHTEKIYGYFDDAEVQEVYKQLNNYRKSNGLSELNYNSTLQWASNQRALDCITYFEHTRPNGKRWNTVTSEWTYGGENIALGYSNASKVMTGWKNSPGHNSNMLYSTYKGVSIACFKRVVFDNGSNIPRVCSTIWSQNFTFYKY